MCWKPLQSILPGEPTLFHFPRFAAALKSSEGRHMPKTKMVQTKDERKEFYDWLLWRAQEEEGHGRESTAQAYREFAEIMQTGSLDLFKCTPRPKGG